MALFRFHWTDRAPDDVLRGAISFGNFDGVHRGHQKLMGVLKSWARKHHGPAVAITFDPPPVALLNPQALKAPLTTIEDRSEFLHAAGANHVVAFRTDARLLALSAQSFIEDVIQTQFEARAIVEGSNFRFGRGREGENSWLNTLEYRSNINFEEVTVDDVSSSRVRECINCGDVAAARELLGRPYGIRGTVVEGAKRGRTLGFPTANLDAIPTLVPAVGVYTVDTGHGRGAANIGPNPTFGEDARKVEIHIMDFKNNIYGQSLDVRFLQRLRDTKPFAGIEQLQQQLSLDIAAARRAT